MGLLIMMQHTVNLMATKCPEKLEALGKDWKAKGVGEDKYFVDQEV